MNEQIVPLEYGRVPHFRRHGPRGYSDSPRYKSWLRDEFTFRCVYCLIRERWCPDGEDVFSVEHFQPRALAVETASSYDNLLYTCCRCNAELQRATTSAVNEASYRHSIDNTSGL